MLKGTSRFGAELDSLADFLNFGVAPALILYFWGLHELGNVGWIAAMVFAISARLRLARFNVMIDDPNKPAWAGNFFVGMPAPAGAITVLLPIYVYFLGMPRLAFVAPVTLVYTLAIAFLMVSRLPVFSGKRVGKRIAPEMVLPVFVAVVLFFALLVSYPWIVLTIGTVLYLGSLPLGWISYRKHERKDAATASAALASPDARPRPHGEDAPSLSPGHPEQPPHRPTRLNWAGRRTASEGAAARPRHVVLRARDSVGSQLLNRGRAQAPHWSIQYCEPLRGGGRLFGGCRGTTRFYLVSNSSTVGMISIPPNTTTFFPSPLYVAAPSPLSTWI